MPDRRTPSVFVNLAHAYDHLFMLLYPTVVLALERAWGLAYDELLALAIGGFVAFAAGTLPAGWLGDRWSRSGMLTVFFVGIGLSSIATGLARTPFEIAFGLTLIGLFASIYHPVGTALVVDGAARVGRALGRNGVFGNMGVAFAALVAGGLSDLLGWRWAFIVPGAVAVATGVTYRLCLHGDAEPRFHATAAVDPGIARRTRNRVYAVLVVAALCGGMIYNAMTVALPKVFDERLEGLADTAFGVGGVLALVYALAAFAQIAVGRLIDRFAIKPIFLGLVLLQVPVLSIAGVLDGAPLLAVVFVAMVLIFGEIPIHDALVARYTASAWRSRAYAVKYLIGLGVGALGVPLIALVYRSTGDFTWLFAAYAAFALIVAVAAAFLPRESACGTASHSAARAAASPVAT